MAWKGNYSIKFVNIGYSDYEEKPEMDRYEQDGLDDDDQEELDY
jgi:hypothetical protein